MDDELEGIRIEDVDDDVFANLILPNQPRSLEESLEDHNPDKWIDALHQEYLAQIKNQTWDITNRPADRKVIKSRLVLQTKYNSKGEELKKKIRLVAKGCAQQPGIDFHETYAPVIKSSSIIMVMALAVKLKLKVHQMDVVTAYLNGKLEESVYMEIPEHLEEILKEILEVKESPTHVQETARKWLSKVRRPDQVCLLKKALYGLKQAGRQWFRKLDQKLQEMELSPLSLDPCLFIRRQNHKIILVAVYVDDLIIATNDDSWLSETKRQLGRSFEMKDLGPINYCLGIEFKHDLIKNEISMCQRKYVDTES